MTSVSSTTLSRTPTLWLMMMVHRFLPLLKRLHIIGPDILVPVVTLLMSIVLQFPLVNRE